MIGIQVQVNVDQKTSFVTVSLFEDSAPATPFLFSQFLGKSNQGFVVCVYVIL